MRIAGLQKVSTIDYPGKISCIVFLHGCNFRCGFCYNPDLVIKKCGNLFSEEYVLDFLSRRIDKLDAVCISGGEALMTLDFDFVRKIKDMGFNIKVDTNGSFPIRLKKMIDLGLVDYIAMDIKGARDDYKRIANVDVNISKIEESIGIVNDFVCNLGEGEFRTTIVKGLHDVDSLIRMGRWMGKICDGKPEKIFLQGFKVVHSGMIDGDFEEKGDFPERKLVMLKNNIGDLFEEVGIRV